MGERRLRCATGDKRFFAIMLRCQTKDNRTRKISSEWEWIEDSQHTSRRNPLGLYHQNTRALALTHIQIYYARAYMAKAITATKEINLRFFCLNGKSALCVVVYGMPCHVICINPDRYGNVSILSWVDIRFKSLMVSMCPFAMRKHSHSNWNSPWFELCESCRWSSRPPWNL